MRVLLILSLLLLGACGVKTNNIIMGETSRADLLAEKGEALSEHSIPNKDGTVLKFKNHETYQLKGDIVVNSFTNPKGNQKLVMWWKHKFKDCLTTKTNLALDPKSHTPPEIEFACPSEGLSVIYTEGSDLISRVVENEKK